MNLENLRRQLPEHVMIEGIQFDIKLVEVHIDEDPFMENLTLSLTSVYNTYRHVEKISKRELGDNGIQIVDRYLHKMCSDIRQTLTTPSFEM